MSVGIRPGFRPVIGEELIKFTGLHGIDSGKYVGKICNRINVVAFARYDEGKMYRRCLPALVGAYEQEVLASQYEVLDCPFGTIVINVRRIHPMARIAVRLSR
jgi:hypothetical protein